MAGSSAQDATERRRRVTTTNTVMASSGLSSWLGNSKAAATKEGDATEQQTIAARKSQTDDSPLDITLEQLRAKETITRISPDKRGLVEEIDSEADDAEFDERAHWGRRRVRKKARSARRCSLQDDKSQPSIALFCVKEGPAVDAANVAKKERQTNDDEATKTFGAVVASRSGMSQLESVEFSDPPRDPAAEISPEKKAANDDDGENEAQTSESPLPSGSVPSPVMSSGRPKRKAVVRAEILQQQQRLLDEAAARKNPPASFLTPPSSTKRTPSKSGSASAGTRKRKLDIDKKKTPPSSGGKTTSSPAAGSAKSPTQASQSFFLSESEKKQLQEIEAVSSFREQLRQTREKDRAFFTGKVVNPFFHARSSSQRSSSAENDDSVIEIDDNDNVGSQKSGTGDDTQRQKGGIGGGRWSKPLPLFPHVQHVLNDQAESDDTAGDGTQLELPKKLATEEAAEGAPVIVLDDDELPETIGLSAVVMGQLKSAVNGQVATETSFSDLFWFREYLDTVHDIEEEGEGIEGSTSPLPDAVLAAAIEEQGNNEDKLVDELVDLYGMRETRVRGLLEGLRAARTKRRDREQNLSFVDRYLPVNASGLVGNRESLRLLSSWLAAWKTDGDNRDCFSSELFTYDEDDSDSEDDVGDLCRLFVLQGESGAGKSAAVYACAEELGYEIIEINAAQNRSGKSIMELAGEATQSTRVLHIGGKESKSAKKLKKKRRRHSGGRRSLEKPTTASLSLVLFEDVDLVFDEDKGFLNALCAIAKHTKCPIVVTCSQLPDAFPATPARVCRDLHKPSMGEFGTWMRVVAFLEGLTLTPALVSTLGNFYERDLRRSLHFLEAHLPLPHGRMKAQWRWQHKDQEERAAATTAITAEDERPGVVIPAWTSWSTGRSSFDALTSNLLVELSIASEAGEGDPDDKSREEKEITVAAMSELANIMDAASLADVWMTPHRDTDVDELDPDASFFLSERKRGAALELRRSSLSMLSSATNPLGKSLRHAQETYALPRASASACVGRTLDGALAATRRLAHQHELMQLKPKFELPLAFKGCGETERRFMLDYMPMVARLLASSAGVQEGRRRSSRRNHYLGDVLGDMALIDELPTFNSYAQSDEDQIVDASSATPPLA